MTKKTIIVPIYVDARWNCGYAVTVEPDARGDVWLTPDQAEALEQAREQARIWADHSIYGTSRPRRRTSKLNPPTVHSGDVATWTQTVAMNG